MAIRGCIAENDRSKTPACRRRFLIGSPAAVMRPPGTTCDSREARDEGCAGTRTLKWRDAAHFFRPRLLTVAGWTRHSKGKKKYQFSLQNCSPLVCVAPRPLWKPYWSLGNGCVGWLSGEKHERAETAWARFAIRSRASRGYISLPRVTGASRRAKPATTVAVVPRPGVRPPPPFRQVRPTWACPLRYRRRF